MQNDYPKSQKINTLSYIFCTSSPPSHSCPSTIQWFLLTCTLSSHPKRPHDLQLTALQ
jgi:hypothetical protein